MLFQIDEKEKRTAELTIANTELIIQNHEREKHAAELTLANKELTTFTYISSHDLQEPLRKIQIYIEMILDKEDKNLSLEGQAHFKRVRLSAKRMQTLIEDLLKYSRANITKSRLEKADLNLILKEVLKDLEVIIEDKKAIVEVHELCHAYIIPSLFRQVIENLISNALKFSKSDSLPHIVIQSAIKHRDEFNSTNLRDRKEKLLLDKKYCHISIADNGIGFDPVHQDRIFEVFQRLHNQNEYKGTGIGLAICKRIIENHNGIITATSQLKKGTRFDIYVPE